MIKTTSKYLSIYICVALVLGIFAIFGQALTYDFITYDDPDNVFENPFVLNGFSAQSIRWAFTSGGELGDCNPMTRLSHMLDREIYGLRPGGHHLTNVLFHAVNAVLLFLVLRFMTGALWPSAFVAAAFALHPLRVESVAWITERKDVLYGFFGILTIAAYRRYAQQPGSVGRYLLLILFFAAALMSKVLAVTLPCVLLLLDYWPLCRLRCSVPEKSSYPQVSLVRLIVEKIPLFLMSAAMSVIAYLADKQIGSVNAIGKFEMSTKVNNALVAYAKYIMMMFWPSKLAVLYPHPGNSLPLWQPIVSAVLLVSISAAILYFSRRKRYLIVGWLWYLGTLLPTIGLVQAGGQAMADRYTYIPLIGLYIIIAWGVAELLANWKARKVVISIATAMVLLALSISTLFHLQYWQNSETLYRRALAVTKNNSAMHNNLGTLLQEQGKTNEAINHYRRAVEIEPNHAMAYNNLGLAFQSRGILDEAVSHFSKALGINSAYAEAHYNLALVFQSQGKVDKAVSHYNQALQANPNDSESHNNLANILVKQGKFDEAISHYNETLRIVPYHAKAHNNLANTLLSQGRITEAIEHYRQALRADPDFVQAHNSFGMILASQGLFDEAIGHYLQALRVKPDFVPALNSLAWILVTHPEPAKRDANRAIVLSERAAELTNYKDGFILATLATAYSAAGQYKRGTTTAQTALELAELSGNEKLATFVRKKLETLKQAQP